MSFLQKIAGEKGISPIIGATNNIPSDDRPLSSENAIKNGITHISKIWQHIPRPEFHGEHNGARISRRSDIFSVELDRNWQTGYGRSGRCLIFEVKIMRIWIFWKRHRVQLEKRIQKTYRFMQIRLVLNPLGSTEVDTSKRQFWASFLGIFTKIAVTSSQDLRLTNGFDF